MFPHFSNKYTQNTSTLTSYIIVNIRYNGVNGTCSIKTSLVKENIIGKNVVTYVVSDKEIYVHCLYIPLNNTFLLDWSTIIYLISAF